MTAHRSHRGEQGFTLVELLVALVILGVVGGMVMTAVVTSLQAASATTSRVIALDELQTAMQRVSRDLRAAELFIITESTAVDREVTVVVFRNGEEQEVTYRVENREGVDVLVREDTGQTLITLVDNCEVLDEDLDENPEENGGAEEADPIASCAQPVFTYLNSDGTEIDCDGDCANAYSKARQVEVRFIRGIDGREPVTVESLVNVRNTRYEGGAY